MLFNQDLLVYLMYLLVPVELVLFVQDAAGAAFAGSGESPQTADALGVKCL
jgi:ABC-type uncharacterized transport system permease subunit